MTCRNSSRSREPRVRLSLSLLFLAVFLMGIGSARAGKTPKEERWDNYDGATGIALNWKWSRDSLHAEVAGKVWNQDGKDYESVDIEFLFTDKDDEKCGEGTVHLGALPRNMKARFATDIACSARPAHAELYQVTAYGGRISSARRRNVTWEAKQHGTRHTSTGFRRARIGRVRAGPGRLDGTRDGPQEPRLRDA